MLYRIEYAEGKCCNYAHSRNDLKKWLALLKDEAITGIYKVYKNGMEQKLKSPDRRPSNSGPNITVLL